MRRVEITRGDYHLFDHEIGPVEYEFFRTHTAAFKRMWQEQKRSFWNVFIDTYDYFIWNHGTMKEFPLKVEDQKEHVSEIMSIMRTYFVDSNASSARTLVMDCVIIAQNRHHVSSLDKASYSQNPFYMKDTREPFRKLFGPPKLKSTFIKLLCGISIYIKFAGAAVNILRRWLTAEEIGDESQEQQYLESLIQLKLPPVEVLTEKQKEKAEVDKILEEINPKYEAMINDMAPHGHQKLIFRHEPDNPVPKIMGLSEGPYELASSGSRTTIKKKPCSFVSTDKKKKRKKKKAKPPCASKNLPTSVVRLDPDQLIEEPDVVVKIVDSKSDIKGPNGHATKAPFTVIVNKGDKPSPRVLDSSWDKYKDEIEQSSISAEVLEALKGFTIEAEYTDEIDTASLRHLHKLHECSNCHKLEASLKKFKRCVRCRGSPNPKYYCTRECQVTDWKNGHRLEHKDD